MPSVSIKFAGTTHPAVPASGIPLKALTSEKTGNEYFALAKFSKNKGRDVYLPFGRSVPALGEKLPESVTVVIVEGSKTKEVVLPLAFGSSMKGKPQRKHDLAVDLPVLGRKVVEIKASDLGDGDWQINAIVRGVSGGGGRKKATDDDIASLF